VTDRILDDQITYYQARAGEYDEWFLRQGRYDRGPVHREQWFREVEKIRRDLRTAIRGCDVLELACGTGLWTHLLAESNARVLAVDASPQAIEINRGRIATTNVDYAVADIFSWRPPHRFDAVFFSFWLSHVPRDRFEDFWRLVGSALKDCGRVFFADSLLEQSSTAKDHAPIDRSGIVTRKLNDGREFEIVKVFYEPSELEHELHALGWDGWVRSAGKFFLYASLTARPDDRC
jgi:2-polyprenyl-3-methyl-5-hydroxy-6-metoxy-1,4-benzoquinol methylase